MTMSTITQKKRQTTETEMILLNYASGCEFVSRMYKELKETAESPRKK